MISREAEEGVREGVSTWDWRGWSRSDDKDSNSCARARGAALTGAGDVGDWSRGERCQKGSGKVAPLVLHGANGSSR